SMTSMLFVPSLLILRAQILVVLAANGIASTIHKQLIIQKYLFIAVNLRSEIGGLFLLYHGLGDAIGQGTGKPQTPVRVSINVPDSPSCLYLPALKFLRLGIKANQHVRFRPRFGIPDDVADVGDSVGTTLGSAGRRPFTKLASLRVESTQVTTGIIGVPNNVVGGNSDTPGTTPWVWQEIFRNLHRVRIDGAQPGTVSLGEERNTKGISRDSVRTRVRRERIHKLNLVTAVVQGP